MKPGTGYAPSLPWEEQVSTETALELRRQQVQNLREKLAHGAETARKLAGVELLCRTFDGGRGIWKQIDENRQLLQFLKGCDPRVEACSRAASIKKTFVGKHEENSDGNRLS